MVSTTVKGLLGKEVKEAEGRNHVPRVSGSQNKVLPLRVLAH
jgi:hypothetical protein